MSKTDEIAVSIRDIHKEFILPQNKNTSLKQAAVNIVRRGGRVTQKVLDGVTFDIHKGDFFGIVGRNGSGKSTLLKLIAGVYYPTAGDIQVNGGLTPFIELGVGFNPELSGRDNVYLNGALLGFTRDEMDAMYDEIVEFAELEPFMGQKLKNYSSGMQVRLAFSIAIKAKNDVLIFDEVLAVGDEAFQRKCLDVFEDYKRSGQTVILVTHDMKTVKEYCNKAALISNGKLTMIGNPVEVADEYSRMNLEVISGKAHEKTAPGIIKAVLRPAVETDSTYVFPVSSELNIDVEWSDEVDGGDVILIDLYKASGEHITSFKSDNMSSIDPVKLQKHKQITLTLPLMIAPGKYSVNVSVVDGASDERRAVVYDVCDFIIDDNFKQSPIAWSGLVPLDHEWSMKN